MPTIRTIKATTPGPAHIETDLGMLDVTVIAIPGLDVAELTIETADDDGPSADLVNSATLGVNRQHLLARIPEAADGGGMTIVQTGRGGGVSIVQTVGNVYGTVVGATFVNGRLVTGNCQGVPVISGGSAVTVTARVPAGSNVTAESVAGVIATMGELNSVVANSTSGRVGIEKVRAANVSTVTGRVEIIDVLGAADVSTVSGHVNVGGGPDTSAVIQSVSGSIHSSGGIRIQARSVSGRISN